MSTVSRLLGSLSSFLAEHAAVSNTIVTALVVLVVVLGYQLIRRTIRRSTSASPEERKRWTVMVRNISVLLLILLLVVIWAEELQTLALSLAAIALALVIAVKELLLCFSGEALRSSTRLFTVGSRIEVEGVRGDVIDLNLLTTTIMEVGPAHTAHQYTGRAVMLPNSVFLTQPVYNESFTRHFQLHTFNVAVQPEAWSEAERAMKQAADAACERYLDRAQRHIEQIGDLEGLDTPTAVPSVTLSMLESHQVRVTVRMAVPAREKNSVQQEVLHRFLELFERTGHLKAPSLHR